MSRILQRIEQSGWSVGVVRDAIQVIGGYFEFSWTDRIEELIHLDAFTEEIYFLDRILDCLLSDGEFLLKDVREFANEGQDLYYRVLEKENEDPSFAREMSALRRNIAKNLKLAGYELLKGLGKFDLWIDEIWNLLQARNASPTQPLREENMYVPISTLEQEYAINIQKYLGEVGWANIPLGEREEALLCLYQHLYSVGEYSKASELFVDAMEVGFQEPLIYYNYFILGLTVGEFEAAMEGYQAACETLPNLSLAPSDRYQVESAINKDRISTTFIGKDLYENQPVLLKILNNPPANVRKAIINAVKLKHAGIGEVYNFHEINKMRPCIAMEYLEGPDMETIIEENGPFPPEKWLQLALQITGALAYAHDQGFVHGNLTPSKLFQHKGEIKIIDFGLMPLDQWSIPLGKQDLPDIYYIAPELFVTNEPLQMTSDIYSLGKVLYYILTGDLPHLMYMEKVPAVIWPILKKATEINPQLRHQNATELLADLAQASESPLSVPATPKAEALPEGVARNRIIPLEDGGTVLLPEKFVYRDGIVISQLDNSQMVLVPEGIFSMGSEDRITESPVHEVYLDHYLIDRYPVTNAQYARFLDYIKKSGEHSKCHPDEPPNKDHTPKGWRTMEYQKYSDDDNCPVIFIDWWDAWAYASWAGKMLPTEAQWEKAARGTDQRKYPWGNEEVTKNLANCSNLLGKTSVVGSFPQGASPYGCMDMAGNVWEWCEDTYDKNFYKESPRDNPVCKTDRPARVLRGGSWNDGHASIRTSCRGCWIQTVRYGYIGFRCVKLL